MLTIGQKLFGKCCIQYAIAISPDAMNAASAREQPERDQDAGDQLDHSGGHEASAAADATG